MKAHAFVPSPIAPLETRVTPSSGTVAAPHALVPAVNLKLYGIAFGTENTVGPVHELLKTTATISPLGTVTVGGYLAYFNRPGQNEPAHGLLELTNAKGTLTIELSGTVNVTKSALNGASGNLTYTVLSGTKDDVGMSGSGSVGYGPGPVLRSGRYLLDFGGAPPPP